MTMEPQTVTCRHVGKVYRQYSVAVQALTDINLEIPKKDFLCLSGPSGSGKSTLLNLIGGLDKPTSGEIEVDGIPLASLTKGELAQLRLQRIGFVFQAYNLIPVLTARENVEFVMQLQGLPAEERGDKYPPLFPEAAARLAAAATYLRGKGLKKVAIVSHSMGSRMTNYFLNHAGDARIDAWVAIGLSGEFTDPATFNAPVFDLYGERDYAAVLDGAAKRAAAIRRIRGSGQMQVAGADHFFAGMENELVHRVKQFLDSRLKR